MTRIPIRVPYGTTYTITTTGSAWKPLKCEFCGCEFAYKLKCSEQGRATNYLWLNKKGTVSLATKRSQKKLQKSLESGVGVYSCPACGKYQKKMVRHLQGKRWETLTDLIVIVIFLAVFVGLIIYASNAALATQLAPILIGGGLALIVILLLAGLLYSPRKADPRHAPGRTFSDTYPVMRREQMEQIAAQARAQGKEIELPKWPGK